jgi:hypothetical protein
MDDFSAYLLEKEGKHTFQMNEGFFVWKQLHQHNELWVCFLYLKPEHRRGIAFANFATQLRALGEVLKCKQIVADIDIRNNDTEKTLNVFFKLGMKISHIEDNHRMWLYYPLINNSNEEVSNG